MPFTELSRFAARAFERLTLWSARASQRRALAELDDNLLKDIGLTRHEAFGEAVRPFWDSCDQSKSVGREMPGLSPAWRP